MKFIVKLMIPAALLCMGICMIPSSVRAQDAVSIQVFYDDMSPYGTWVDNPSYGYVWCPNAGGDFRPYYSGGHWAMTDYGWTWVSDYAWGWAPFHYGRWETDDTYGWVWIPETTWGPGWVDWSQSDGYYGWSPQGYKHHHDRDDQWVYVHDRDFYRTDVDHYYVDKNENAHIHQGASSMGHSGPHQGDVEKKTGQKVNILKVQKNTQPGQQVSGNQMNIYRPAVKQNSSGPKAAPKNVKSAPAANTTNTKQPQKQPKQQPTPQSKPQPQKQPKQQPPKQQAKPKQQAQPKQQQPQQQKPPKQQAQPKKQAPQQQPHQQAPQQQQQQQQQQQPHQQSKQQKPAKQHAPAAPKKQKPKKGN